MKELEKLNTILERTRTRLKEHKEFVETQLAAIQDTLQECGETIPKVEAELSELTTQMKQNQDSIDDLTRKIDEVERLNLLRQEEIATLQTQIDELDSETESVEGRIADSEERLQTVTRSLRDFQTDLEDISNQIQMIERDIEEAREESEQSVSAKNLERDETEQELETLREDNAIADFLLEAVGDSEELRFIATLIQKSDLTVGELCAASGASREAADQIIESLEDEGWIKLRGNGTIRFLKPL